MKTKQGKFAGKTVIITNAAGSVGLAAARLFWQEDANIIINDTRTEMISQLAEELGSKALATFLDLTKAEAGIQLAQSALDRFKSIDILVCNEGYSSGMPMDGITSGEWSKMMEKSLLSIFHVLQGVYESFRKKQEGNVVLVSSVAARSGCPGAIDYASSMGGILGIMKMISREWSRWGVTCSAVCPGPIAEGDQGLNPRFKGQFSQTQVELANLTVTAEQVARVILFLSSEDGRPINGQAINVDYGLYIYPF